MASFYGWGSTASRLEPLRGGSLLFTTFVSVLAKNNQVRQSVKFMISSTYVRMYMICQNLMLGTKIMQCNSKYCNLQTTPYHQEVGKTLFIPNGFFVSFSTFQYLQSSLIILRKYHFWLGKPDMIFCWFFLCNSWNLLNLLTSLGTMEFGYTPKQQK